MADPRLFAKRIIFGGRNESTNTHMRGKKVIRIAQLHELVILMNGITSFKKIKSIHTTILALYNAYNRGAGFFVSFFPIQ